MAEDRRGAGPQRTPLWTDSVARLHSQPSGIDPGRAPKDKFVVENAFRSAGFPKLDLDMEDGNDSCAVLY